MRESRRTVRYAMAATVTLAVALLLGARGLAGARGAEAAEARAASIARGRTLVMSHGCSGCHGGNENVASEGWLSGSNGRPDDSFLIGPCAADPAAKPCFHTYPRNITPDNTTGIGRFTERQLFNALRYGLRPGETPDVDITSTVPGKGNFPATPKYLAVPMPWPAFRHMSDQELRDVVAYLKYGVKPVHHRVPDSEGPPDFWASEYSVAKYGTWPAPPFPTKYEAGPTP